MLSLFFEFDNLKKGSKYVSIYAIFHCWKKTIQGLVKQKYSIKVIVNFRLR